MLDDLSLQITLQINVSPTNIYLIVNPNLSPKGGDTGGVGNLPDTQ